MKSNAFGTLEQNRVSIIMMSCNFVNLQRYISSCCLVKVGGNIVGIPGMNVLSCSDPAHRERLRRVFFSSD